MKGFKGKIISIILTIALATGVFSVNGITAKAEAVSYYLYMGNNEVTSENTSGEGWSYDPENSVLTLNDYHYDGEVNRDSSAISYYGQNDLTIRFIGYNYINAIAKSDSTAIYGIFSNCADLTFEGEEDEDGDAVLEIITNGFDEDHVLTTHKCISVSGTMTINSGFLFLYPDEATTISTGIYTTKDLVINDGGLKSYGGYAKNSFGVMILGNMTINGGETNLYGEDNNSYSNGWSLGIYLDGDFEITDGTLIAYGGDVSPEPDPSNATMGIYSRLGNVTVSGGSVLAAGGETEYVNTYSCGICCDDITINSGLESAVAYGSMIAGYCDSFSNEISGTGYTDADGTQGKKTIKVNALLDELDGLKHIEFTGKPITATSKGFTGKYDGKKHGISVNVTEPESGAVVYYGTEKGTYELTESPAFTDVGEYTVYYKVTAKGYANKKGEATVCITKAEQTVTASDMTMKVGEKKKINAKSSFGEKAFTYLVEGDCVNVDSKGNVSALKEGKATVTVIAPETKNYYGGSAEITITVSGEAEKTYKVTFNANGHGKAPAAQTVTSGKKAKKPADPAAKGYVFGGWFTTKECKKGTEYNFNTAVTKNITLYAKWTKDAKTVDMLRLYNPNSGEHFYTSSVSEKETLVKAGWKYEGFAWKAPATSKSPVYRLYNKNAGDHHYTMSKAEKETLEKAGWAYEGIGWYSDDAKGVPLYRLYNPNAKAGSHHYTTSASEKDALIKAGWKDEGVAWFGIK